MLFSAMTLPSCWAASMCAGLVPLLEPQKTQIFVRGVLLLMPFVLAVPFWPAMGALDDIVTWLLAVRS